MEQLSKRVRKLLREAAGLAHERELSRELEALHADFERWRRGEMTPFELGDAIHRFHQGPNRKLFVHYTDSNPMIQVAGAVHRGVLSLDELVPDLHPHVSRLLSVLVKVDATG